MWQEVTKEQIDIAMLMPGEYKEEDGKFYIKPGMLDGYICDELYRESIKNCDKIDISGILKKTVKLKGMIYGKNFEMECEDAIVCQAIETRLGDLMDVQSKNDCNTTDLFPNNIDIDIEETKFERAIAESIDYNIIKKARKIMRKAFDSDEQLKWGYICNIAMHLYDELCKDGLKLEINRRNEIAEKMLKVIFYLGETK